MSLTLYYHPLASYCHKVLIALYEHGLPFEKRLINLGDPEERSALEAVWPMAKFPVLHDAARGRDVPESSIIIEYLDQLLPEAQPLLPRTAEQALEVRLWDRFFDSYVHQPMQDIVLDHIRGGHGDMAHARSTLKTAYKLLEERMAKRQWACGETFSLADCAATPALFYACTLLPFPEEYPQLAAYFERLVARPSVQRVLEEAKPFFQYYPFESEIASRFR
jgi:glutathione S-transferase